VGVLWCWDLLELRGWGPSGIAGRGKEGGGVKM